MRKNFTHTAKEARTRNELIDMVQNNENVIVLGHNVIEELDEEITKNIKLRKRGNFFSKIALPMAILSSGPLGWFLSGAVFLCGGMEKALDYFKRYDIYLGYDICLRKILTFHLRESVDLKYDKIEYPSWVGKIEYKKIKKNIKKRIK